MFFRIQVLPVAMQDWMGFVALDPPRLNQPAAQAPPSQHVYRLSKIPSATQFVYRLLVGDRSKPSAAASNDKCSTLAGSALAVAVVCKARLQASQSKILAPCVNNFMFIFRLMQVSGAWRKNRLVFFHIQVLPIGMQNRMFLEALDPRPCQPVADSGGVQIPSCIGFHLTAHLNIELIAFRARRQGYRLAIQCIVGSRLITPEVAPHRIGSVQ